MLKETCMEWTKSHNELMQTENKKRQAQEKSVLTSIKERVWKTHKSTFLRRKKQLKEFAPPSTFEIYTTNQHSKMLRRNF